MNTPTCPTCGRELWWYGDFRAWMCGPQNMLAPNYHKGQTIFKAEELRYPTDRLGPQNGQSS